MIGRKQLAALGSDFDLIIDALNARQSADRLLGNLLVEEAVDRSAQCQHAAGELARDFTHGIVRLG